MDEDQRAMQKEMREEFHKSALALGEPQIFSLFLLYFRLIE
jgi:hypothetical protein